MADHSTEEWPESKSNREGFVFDVFGFISTAESCLNIGVTIQCCEIKQEQICQQYAAEQRAKDCDPGPVCPAGKTIERLPDRVFCSGVEE